MDGYTNVCEATSQSHDLNSFRPTHRKGKKLLAEKKRRARINNCLTQIRDIVCDEEEAKDNDIDKMEKAEILEKTLEVLTKLRNEHDGKRSSLSSHKAMAVRYASGFSSCAEESIRYIQCSRLVPSEVKHQLQTHLRSIARRMENSLQDPSVSYDLSYVSPPVVNSTPVSSLPANQALEPPTSSSLLPLSNNTPRSPRISPSTRLDFSQNVSAPAVSQIDSYDTNVNAPSPILTSTPVLHVQGCQVVNIPFEPQGYQNSQSHFSPITAHDFAQEHKENHPSDSSHLYVPTSYSLERKKFSPQGHSAFRRANSDSLATSPSPSKERHESLLCARHPSSSSISSSSPSSSLFPVASSQLTKSAQSHYSPISPASSPVPSMVSAAPVLPPSHRTPSAPMQQIYQYHGYEPYPVFAVTSSLASSCSTVLSEAPTQTSSLNLSQSIPTTTSSNALDLCTKRSQSHNISPETMWRPW